MEESIFSGAGKRKLMNSILYGTIWLQKNIQTEKILLLKTICSMKQKMKYCTKKQLKGTRELMVEKWMKCEICTLKPEVSRQYYTEAEYFIAEEPMSFRYSPWLDPKPDSPWTIFRQKQKKDLCTITIFLRILAERQAEWALRAGEK